MKTVVYFGYTLLLLGSGLAQSSAAPFSITIAAAQTEEKSGSEVRVNLTLKNVSNRNITVELTSPLCDYTVEVRDRAGKVAPDTELKRVQNCESGRVKGRDIIGQLKPNESIKDEIPVSQLSDMSQPGEYSVQVLRRASKEFGEVVVKSNTIKITVTP
jgi:hypothetical protein